jgi:predicted Fe-Mo cluster-binding NifX family protein
MRIAISADSNEGLDSVVAQHFGRCPFFVIVDVTGGQVRQSEVIENPFYGQHQPGQVPGFIKSQNINVMISSGMGGRAIQFFRQYGVGAATGASGTARQAIEDYVAGRLQDAAPCRESVEHGHDHVHP